MAFRHAVPMLTRRGYVVEGRIFSSAFRDFIAQQIRRIELNVETGEVRIERRLVELPPKEFVLLRFLLENEGEVVTKDEIAMAVWPEYHNDTLGVTDAMIQKTISRLRKEVDVPESEFQHIESVRGQGYRFQNASLFEVASRRPHAEVTVHA
jgi:DNA-binding response OmpR family regulator